MKLTDAQKAAVETRGRNILVSAAAGSGKTATLTKRITDLLTTGEAPASLSDMLVVTFTRAAAAELKSRITAALTKELITDPGNRHLAMELTSVNSAEISTIDSFYNTLVKENFQRLGIPSSFRIATEEETAALRSEILDEIIERRLDSDAVFTRFADTVSNFRSDDNVPSTIEGLTAALRKLPSGTDYLLECAEEYDREAGNDYLTSRSGKYMLGYFRGKAENHLSRIRTCIGMAEGDQAFLPYAASLGYLEGYLSSLLAAIDSGDPDEIRRKFADFSPAEKGRVKKKTDETVFVLNEQNAAVSAIRDFAERFVLIDRDEVACSQRLTSEFCRTLHSVITEYVNEYTSRKLSLRILDFSDLTRYAMQLLCDENGNPTDVAREVGRKYSHIFVDEYQDTDGMQDLIFRLISDGHNLFIVGDIKQSIYSFRNAKPQLFADYREKWTPLDKCTDKISPCSIYMSENFRCAENVIRFTNLVCSYVFRALQENGRKGIGYRKEDDLVFSREGPDSHTPVKIVLCERNPKTPDPVTGKIPRKSDGTDPEGEYIAGEILRIVREEKKPDGSPYTFGDIAVLARKNKTTALISETLAKKGIPFNNADGEELLENPEVLLFYSVLSAVDNPQKDIPLAAAMKSPFFGFTLSDLVRIRMDNSGGSLWDSVADYSENGTDADLSARCAAFIQRMNNLRKKSEAVPIDRFIRILWRESSAMSYAGASGKKSGSTPEDMRRNLRMLYDFALHFQSTDFRTLHDFVVYVADYLSRGNKIKLDASPAPDSVQLMTVHKSKGLEFPVVFLCGAAGDIENKASKHICLVTEADSIGFTSRLTDESGFCDCDTPMRLSAVNKEGELLYEEEARILYVALTRAREQLYVVAGGENGFSDKKLTEAGYAHRRGAGSAVCDGRCWLDWMLSSLVGVRKDCFTVETVHPFANAAVQSVPEPAEEKSVGVNQNEEEAAAAEAMRERILRKLDYVYPYASLSGIPSKVSVSRLYPGFLDEDGDYTSLEKRLDFLKPRVPRFTEEDPGAAEKGTATHLFLQFCDFEALDGTEASVKSEAARLSGQKFIPEAAAEMIRAGEIAAFARSELMRRIRAARRVYRETRFNILLPASDFSTDERRAELLRRTDVFVQGVIDLFFEDENGKIILCDYKTDRLTKAEMSDEDRLRERMKETHGEQLRYYAASVEKITGRYPDEILIFPLQYGKSVKID